MPSDDTAHDVSDEQAGGDQDETRRRFQEALAKKGQHRSAAGGAAGKGGVHPHSGPAKAQRTFRRKSG
ncbi:MAG: DUF5302 domain-containing protein [Motilibacteraceae bacterium]